MNKANEHEKKNKKIAPITLIFLVLLGFGAFIVWTVNKFFNFIACLFVLFSHPTCSGLTSG